MWRLKVFFSYSIILLKYITDKISSKRREKVYDLVLLVEEKSRGWILEAICKEIAEYYPRNYCFAYSFLNLPTAKAYFFSHYSFFYPSLKNNPKILGSKLLVFHTHPKSEKDDPELIFWLNRSTKTICMNSTFCEKLVEQGLKKNRATYVIAGADTTLFKPHRRQSGCVGFSTAYYERKDPDRILNIIKNLPHRKFLLLGKNWDKYSRYKELIKLDNLEYHEIKYEEYPYYYSKMDVFVSPAKLEGGPIPLIEAMMCNIVPVASKTGFAPDIIIHEKNGFLFDPEASFEHICELIERAFSLDENIANTVSHLTWKNFSLNIQQFLR